MSQRLLRRGRYVKDASIYQTPGMAMQDRPPVVSTPINYSQPSEVPLYNTQPIQQFQVHQRPESSWQQNSAAPVTEGPNQHQQHNFWTGDPSYSLARPPESNACNWMPENGSHNPQLVQQQQQQQYSHIEKTQPQFSYSTPSSTYDNSYASGQFPLNQSGNVDYMVQNNWYSERTDDSKQQNGNQPTQNIPQSSWEMVVPKISQSEHLPWTFNVPQNTVLNDKFSHLPGTTFVQNSSSSDSVTQSWNECAENSWQEVSSPNNYPQNQQFSTYVSQPSTSVVYSQDSSQVSCQPVGSALENQIYMNKTNDLENFIPCNVENSNVVASKDVGDSMVVDGGGGSLSAFFHTSVEENVEIAQECCKAEKPLSEVANNLVTNEENIPTYHIPENEVTQHPQNMQPSESNSENVPVNGSNHIECENFVQNKSITHSCEENSKEPSLSSSLSAEEPLNQEVPEPSVPFTSSAVPLPTKQIVSEEPSDEPLNQQIPAENCPASSIHERNVSTHRGDSPFKQPMKSNVPGPVVQTETLNQNTATGFQEVNLETVPDNLELPPDYDDSSQVTSLAASFRQHLRDAKENHLDTSKASLLDDLNLPCVLFAPAAPRQPILMSVAKDEHLSQREAPPPKEQKLDDKQEAVDSENHSVSVVTSALEKLDLNTPVSSSAPAPSIEKKTVTLSTPSLPVSDVPKDSTSHSEIVPKATSHGNGNVHKSASPVKEQRYAASSSDVSAPELTPFHPEIAKEQHSRSFSDVRNKSFTHDYEYRMHNYHNNYNRSFERYPDSTRFNENRYSSFEERPYSDKESSRPSSRMSLDDCTETHMNHEQGYRKHYSSDCDRPPSRMSESEAYRSRREGSYPYFDPAYSHGLYREDYYRMGYRGGDYGQYMSRQPYYGYDPYHYAYSNYNYGFYDELYRNDPRYRKQYEDYYREYYKRPGYETDYERSSAYSGRSSANELTKEAVPSRYPEHNASSSDMQYQQNYELQSQFSSFEVSDGQQNITPAPRLTPAKFSSPHIFANISPTGQLITLLPRQSGTNCPLIEIHDMQVLTEELDSYKELQAFQGPLVRRETHKNDIIDFCLQKVKFYKQKEGIPDRESYILLWELLILLLRQNGSVAGSDIAELLLKDHELLRPAPLRHTDIVQSDSSPAEVGDGPSAHAPAGDASSPDEGIVVTRDKTTLNTAQRFDVDKVTRKFREFLLFGHKKDALEWAMKHDLWGHALFLASKMDVRTYANVMTRFANSLALNDPLQTLYQLMSGRQPAAVTCIADKQWGDWRPHLAMILSNPSAHSEVDSKSITTLGDTLAAQGCLPATHFCYLMAQVEFGAYFCKSSKMVLLSADHQLPFGKFATNEAIQCTEIYEYAQSLANPGFILNHLVAYKFIYATRLADHGFIQEALHYCEVMASNLVSNPRVFPYELIKQVYELASKLKYYDPHYLQGQGELEDQEDPEWLIALAAVLENVQQDNFVPVTSSYMEPVPENLPHTEVYKQHSVEETVQELPSNEGPNENYYNQHNQQNTYSNTWITGNILQQQQVESYEQQQPQPPPPPQLPQQQDANQYQPGFVNTQWNINSLKQQEVCHENQAVNSAEELQYSQPTSSIGQRFNFYSSEAQTQKHSAVQRERTSSASSIGLQKDRRDSNISSGSDYGSSAPAPPFRSGSENQKAEEKTVSSRPQVGRSWLGGIFSRLLPRGPNQMILPDDKNPTIVWDSAKNCWVNTDANEEDSNTQPAAPPKDVELINKTTPEMPSGPSVSPVAAASTPISNRYQRPKVKGMRQNYVDILNANPTTKNTSSMDVLFPTMPITQTMPNVFIPPPPPVSDDQPVDFISSQQHNYSSSQAEDVSDVPKAPPMFDPAEFDSRKSSISSMRHSVGPAHRTYPT